MTEKTKQNERKLKLGNGYWLCNDPYCWWIEKEYVFKEGKHKGETFRKNITGWCVSAENAFEGLSDYHTKAFDTKSIKVLIKEIKSTRAMLKKMLKDVEVSRHIADTEMRL